MTTMEVMEGMKKPARKIPAPGILRLMITARINAKIVVKGMVPNTKMEVFSKAFRKSSSEKSLLKFSKPTQ